MLVQVSELFSVLYRYCQVFPETSCDLSIALLRSARMVYPSSPTD